MNRTEKKLHDGAEWHIPGSGDACVDVYRCAKTLRMAATLSSFLQDERARKEALADMREQVDGFASSRRGPKRDRHTKALAALEVLGRLTESVLDRPNERYTEPLAQVGPVQSGTLRRVERGPGVEEPEASP